MRDLITWRGETATLVVATERPRALTRMEWPPNYDSVFRWRIDTLKNLNGDPKLLAASKTYYASRPAEFIMDWMDTYDPRKTAQKWMPFVFFEKQVQLVEFFESLDHDQESGLIEKCRDMGATWVACAYSIWRWLFIPNDAIGWGSRKEALVDKLGDADSIFEKMRLLINRLPRCFIPKEFNAARHATYMKLKNPENGSIISGEAGDNIGRGGRKSLYFKDEAAHYERPDKIEAALGDNTNVQVDISSVNGLGNVFHRRAEQALMWEPGKSYPRGFVRKFIMDWRDHPAKTQEWYEARKAKAEREGMLHLFAQEVDRNYSAAVQNVIISHDWIMASVDAHLKVPYLRAEYERRLREKGSLGQWIGGLDVGDSQDGDRNALTLREWIIWRSVEEWVARDTGVTARIAIERCQPYAGNIEIMYDCIGVGAGVKTEYNRLTLDDHIIDPRMVPFVPWNAGAEVLRKFERVIPDDDESPLNKDFYDNMKAQAWWSLRTRFFKTFKAVTEGVVYPCDDLISLDSTMSLLHSLAKELAQPTRGTSGRLKMIVDKKPDGTRSPNLADSGVQAFFPIPTNGQHAIVGTYG
jgi:phage terminase large subunit